MAINNPWIPNYGGPAMPTAIPQVAATPIPTINNQYTNPGQVFFWVQGEQAAKAYPLVGNNARAYLMDTESPTLYLKTTDTTGRPLPMAIYDLKERVDTPPVETSNSVSKEDIAAMIAASVRDEVDRAFKRHNKKRQREENE